MYMNYAHVNVLHMADINNAYCMCTTIHWVCITNYYYYYFIVNRRMMIVLIVRLVVMWRRQPTMKDYQDSQ